MLANKLIRKGIRPIVVEPNEDHYYQPGFLFVPFGRYKLSQLRKKITKVLNSKVDRRVDAVERIDATKNILLLKSGSRLSYDILVIATGTKVDPSQTEGLLGEKWHQNIFDFYTPEGASALAKSLNKFESGKLVVQIMDMPIKCPVAPLEFTFLVDDYFRKKKRRSAIEICYVTPLSGAFTKPVASAKLGYLLKEKNIEQVTDFYVEKVDQEANKVVCYDGREVSYDMLVTVPVNVGAAFLQASDFTNDLGFVTVNHHSLQSTLHPNIFAVGDAADLPTSKAGSVAHFEVDTLLENILRMLNDEQLMESFDGHSNCFVESGHGKALLLDFNYEVEPLEGKFPFAGIGPLKLLNPSRFNHIGKLAFRYIYWYMLLPGRKIPFIPAQMSMNGKKQPKNT